jgi:hypothetical protein
MTGARRLLVDGLQCQTNAEMKHTTDSNSNQQAAYHAASLYTENKENNVSLTKHSTRPAQHQTAVIAAVSILLPKKKRATHAASLFSALL